MNRRDFIYNSSIGLTSAIGGCTGLNHQQSNTSNRLPNIIVIFTDDQGYQDLGCYGGKGLNTPNLDGMANDGIKFTSFCVSAPFCTPSRASLMTGCYAARVGLHHGVLFPYTNYGLNPEEITIAEILHNNGYATGCIGKWHLGHQEPFLPTNHGFDSYYGLPYSNDMGAGKTLPLMSNSRTIEVPVRQESLTQRYTKSAKSFIQHNAEKPFFLYLAHTFPHLPWYASRQFKGKSKRGLYGDMIEEIDWSVGEIINELERLGLTENTLILFTSDNGPASRKNGGSAAPLRGSKGTTWEGGVRVPCIAKYPGHIPAGSVCSELASTIDFLPTLSALTGAQIPQDRIIDGKDIRPLLFGKPNAKTPHNAYFYWHSHWRPNSPNILAAVRSGPWKYHIPGARNRNKPEENLPAMLFNLDDDVGESNNQIETYPHIAKRLHKIAMDHIQEIEQNKRPALRLS